MAATLRKIWIELLFVLLFFGILFAGMRGFSYFFPCLLSVGLARFLLMGWRLLDRLLERKRTARMSAPRR